jgi:anti-sigma B factor antagonist
LLAAVPVLKTVRQRGVGVGIQQFSVARSIDGETATVRVHGDVDLSSAGLLGTELKAAVAESGTVIADLSGVSFLDSTGVRALVDAYRSATKLGRNLYVEGAHSWVAKVLDMTGVGPLLARPATDAPRQPSP